MKLSEYKNEKAIEILGQMIAPISSILADEKVKKAYANGEDKLGFVQALLTNHPKEIVQILAILDDTPVDEYEVSLTTLPKKVLEIINDEALQDFFESQGQNLEWTSSGSATANTEAIEGT